MNIILKSFDGDPFDKPMIERAFQNIPIDTCVSIIDQHELWRAFRGMNLQQRGSMTTPTDLLPHLSVQEYIQMDAKLLREGQYLTTDWNQITPLDEDLIEHMRHAEGIFMTMVSKYAKTRDMPFSERKRQYYAHVRFWNHELTTRKINFVLMNHPPHQCYDYVMYCLCKLQHIPLLYLERILTVDALFLVEDWEEGPTDFRDHLAALRTKYHDEEKIPLSPQYEHYFTYYRTQGKLKPWYQLKYVDPGKQSFIGKWGKAACRMLLRKPHILARCALSREFWSRKIGQHRTAHFYAAHTQKPDLTKPFIYLPLHYQPEATTSPQAGAFVDQELIVQLIASCIPPDVCLYVKEHPLQGERWRSEEFYQSMLRCPSVSFVPKTTDTFQLIDHSLAVASATGSVIFEAILRQKPSLMFGHFFYQYGPSVYQIRSREDCKHAMENILSKKTPPHSMHDIRLFLKAIDDTAVPFVKPKAESPDSPYERFTQAEKAELMGAYIEKRIRNMLLT